MEVVSGGRLQEHDGSITSMITSTTFILPIATVDRSSTQLQVIDLVDHSDISDALAKSKHLP